MRTTSRMSPVFATLAAVTASSLVACTVERAPAPAPPGSSAVAFDESAWKPPAESEIPNDSIGASIRRGLALLRFTPESLPKYVHSNMRCTSCHQNDGTKVSSVPLTGSHARFPKYNTRSGKVISLADRVNFCMTRSLAGDPLPADSRAMNDILTYLAFISRDVPTGRKLTSVDGLIPMKDTLAGRHRWQRPAALHREFSRALPSGGWIGEESDPRALGTGFLFDRRIDGLDRNARRVLFRTTCRRPHPGRSRRKTRSIWPHTLTPIHVRTLRRRRMTGPRAALRAMCRTPPRATLRSILQRGCCRAPQDVSRWMIQSTK